MALEEYTGLSTKDGRYNLASLGSTFKTRFTNASWNRQIDVYTYGNDDVGQSGAIIKGGIRCVDIENKSVFLSNNTKITATRRSNIWWRLTINDSFSIDATNSNYTNCFLIAGVKDDFTYFGLLYEYGNITGKWGFYVVHDSNSYNITNLLNGSVDNSDNPFIDGGTSTTGGGGGDFDNTSQPVDFPDLPSFTVYNTGLVTSYKATPPDLYSLRDFLWSRDLLDNLFKTYANPIDLIVSLNVFPCNVPTSEVSSIDFGNVASDVTMARVSNQFIWVDCGTVHLNEYWGAYLDYNPYTKLSIVLPYIGTQQLNVDECMGRDIHVKYMVDLLTGVCVAHIKCGQSVMYTFSGTCAWQIPLSSANYSEVYSSIVKGLTGATMSAVSGNGIGVAENTVATALNVVSSKPQYSRNGAVTSNSGYMSHQYPYLILERPNQCLPMNQNKLDGYPSFIDVKLNTLTGYNRIYSCHLDNLSCTDSEKNELMQILKEGVIF